MGITNSNKQIDTPQIGCDGTLKVTLALSASRQYTGWSDRFQKPDRHCQFC